MLTETELEGIVGRLKTALTAQNAEVMVVATKAQADIAAFGAVQEGTKQAVADLNVKGGELHARLSTIEQTVADVKAGGERRAKVEKSVGERFVESEEFKTYVTGGGRGKSRTFELKAITSLNASAGQAINPMIVPGVIEEPLRPLSIRQLCDSGSTNSNLIEAIRELVYTSNAAVVSEGATKPESDVTYERFDVPVRTMAHWIKATRQVLADFPQLQSLINGRLTYGLKIEEENELLLGDGTGEHILGLIPQATAYNTALNRPADTMIDILNHAILQVRLAFYPASGIVLTPTDWHTLELTKDGQDRYLLTAPSGRAPAMLWGLPVVESDGMPDGDFMVGAFRMAATVFDREQASIMVSTEDGDNFVRNMVTILAEERLALLVTRPAAFVHGGWPIGLSTG